MDESNLNVEGAGAGEGATESQPGVSQQGQPSIDGMAEQLLATLKPSLQSTIEELTKPYLSQMEGLRKVQGDIDRSRNEFKERLAELNKLTKAGMSQEEAIEHLDKQKAESERWQSLQDELANLRSLIAGNSQGTGGSTVANVFQQYGLDVKDPRVAPLLTKQYKNKDEMEMAALKAFHQLSTQPNPNPAQGASLQGGAGNRKTKDISNITDPDKLYEMAEQDLFK